MSATDYDTASFIISSKYRVQTVKSLHEDGPATPSILADRNEADIAHVSRSLQELREKGIVQLLVSEERKKGRVYGLMDDQESVLEKVEQLDGGRIR